MSNSTDNHSIDTDSSLESFNSVGNLYKSTSPALVLLQPAQLQKSWASAEIMVELVKEQLPV